MLQPVANTLRPIGDSGQTANDYFLSDVRLEISCADTAVFRAKLNRPAGSQVWARAWLSNEMDGTLAEAASPPMNAGDEVMLTVLLRDTRIPENAFIRIESSPLATEQVVFIQLPKA